jgi:ATP-dependent helicase/nuclease subunit B
MPPLVLRVIPEPDSLLREAADGANGFRMDRILLAVRQGGIRDDLYRIAGEAGCPGWFDPPVCTFHELPERLGLSGRVPLSDDERAVLLERLFTTHGGEVFGRLAKPAEFVDPMDTFFGELVSQPVTPDQFDAAVGRAKVHEEWDGERNRAVAAVYRAWHGAIAAATPGRRDGRGTLLDVATTLAQSPDAVIEELHGRRELRILGLTDLRGGWRALIAALRASRIFERITVYALDEHLKSEGLEPDETRRNPSPVAPLASLGAGSARSTLLHAPDTDREVEEIAVRVRRLLDNGVQPHRIAVVSRKARPHLDLALAALERAGVPATARRRIGYREIPVVKSLVFLIQAAAEGWTRHGLSELARQPYFASRLDTRLIDFIGYRRVTAGLDAWQSAFEALVDEARTRETQEEPEDERRGWLPSSERAQGALERFVAFKGVASELDQPKSLVEWSTWLEQFLAEDPWKIEKAIRRVPDGRWEVARVDLAGWKALPATVRSWREALENWGSNNAPIDAERFLARLSAVLSGDASLWTTCRRGVQVLEGLGAADRGFDHVFVLGMEAGVFPVRRPRSAILHEEDRGILREAGLPLDGEEIWEARERALYSALVAGAGHLTLSHATQDAGGREVLASIFLDEARAAGGAAEEIIPTSRVITPGLPVVVDEAAARLALASARMEAQRATGKPSPWNGLIEDPGVQATIAEKYGEEYLWSPTQLESYAKCPWSWFSGRVLRLEKLEDPDQDIDAAVRGTIWHSALEKFWARATAHVRDQGRSGERLVLRTADFSWARRMLSESLDAAWDEVGEDAWLGHPGLHGVTREALRNALSKYLEWELEYHEKWFEARSGHAPSTIRTAVLGHEVRFGPLTLDRGGIRFNYRGTIDRVEIGVDSALPDPNRFIAALDYKSSKWSTPGGGAGKAWEEKVVLQVPLYAHALTQLHPGKAVSRTEYRSIRQCEDVHVLRLYTIKKRRSTPTLEQDSEQQAKMDQALDAAATHVSEVRAGRYPARYVESCKCPPWCHAWDICRVKGGPQGKW